MTQYEVAFTSEANRTATEHLLGHFNSGVCQEDLCFALWCPSTGDKKVTALIDHVILPARGDRNLHSNASFNPEYLMRAVEEARRHEAGLAFMHSHPGKGWQDLSGPDTKAERDVIAYPAQATGYPLLGMTVGGDGHWSARFWEKKTTVIRRPWWRFWERDAEETTMNKEWCPKVRVVNPESYRIHFNDSIARPPERREILKRTYDSWGAETQNTISRLHVGIVGLGSVGCIVAESMARIGVSNVTLIDADKVKQHNLDRFLYGTERTIGKLKVLLAKERMQQHATTDKIQIRAIPLPIQDGKAYKAVLDCDIIFSCVDRPIPRDVLNFIANAHLIPVIDGGIAIESDTQKSLSSAHWRSHIITPYHQCLRCNGQYNSGMVSVERDGSLDDPSYISNLPADARTGNQNVFPFSLATASMMVNMMLRHLIAAEWWPPVKQQDYQFVLGETRIINEQCAPQCEFTKRRAIGDKGTPHYVE